MASLDDLAFFRQLALAGNLTATARELGLSLSAVSKRLKQIEARLGVELATRTTRRWTLTAEGERYLARGMALLEELAELEESLGEDRRALAGPIRINATFGFGRRHVAPLLSDFCAQHPGIEASLELSNFPAPLVEGGDLGIRIGEPPDSRLVARRLVINRRVPCASPDYLTRHGRPVAVSDLQRHACLVLRENDSDFAQWRFEDAQGKEASVKVGGRLASNDGEVIKRLALDGHGIMLRSWWDVCDDLAAGRLVQLLPGWQGVRADFFAVYAQRRHVPARLRALVDFLAKGLEDRIAVPA
ncbi:MULTISPECIES: LysR family transcriptional regulator [Halomonas]|uniref:LysR family transcriptional regulator n=1 Tax=Halomonas TaxID=2745 RepID=UPI001C9608F6|nr:MULTISPECIES: LysR family transcriptional regulator [Halomonas]MBY6208463.1 LysR family transcriptional regulator [Halomonas sp. DP3Y7-2]MBY6226934.1 LysR family transcriptional regulator [Halomonas sp. DP3Y7-1]MCA0915319.1 LysR family transcriptional regulator [Halomonas denitrificans]